MGLDAPWHWVVLAILVIALFGYKRLPDAARSLGRSLRIFRTEMKGMTQDEAARSAADAGTSPAEIAPAEPPAVPAEPAAVPPSEPADPSQP
jgi:sec-independent protein translocase protein TatA